MPFQLAENARRSAIVTILAGAVIDSWAHALNAVMEEVQR